MKKSFTSALLLLSFFFCNAQNPPTAAFSASATSGCTGMTFSFTDLSVDSILTWEWIFENGTPATTTAQNPTVTYSSNGVFDVTLIVTNANGSDTLYENDYITIQDPPVNAGPDQLICQGDSTMLSAQGPIGGAGSLQTTFAAGNGQSGNMFDMIAIGDLRIDSFYINFYTPSTVDVNIYYKLGTFVGSEANAAAWTLVGTALGVVGQPTGTPTPVPINVNVIMPAGQVHGWYITFTSGGTIGYTNGSAQGALYAQDANLQIFEGIGIAWPFGGTFSPRIWNGIVHYSPPIDVDYLWSTGDTTKNVMVAPTDTTSYIVTITDTNGCSNSDTVVVFVLEAPVPTITFNGIQLETQPGFVTYQWYLNGNIIFGANGMLYQPVVNGIYTVVVTNAAINCSGTSAPFTFVGINEIENELLFTVLPNPASDVITIHCSEPGTENYWVEIKNILGELIYSTAEKTGKPFFTKAIDVNDFDAGIYFVRLSNGKAESVRKFIRQ